MICGKDASISNIFHGGGTLSIWAKSSGGGEDSQEYLVYKTWVLYFKDGGSDLKVEFVVSHSTQSGVWKNTDTALAYNTWHHIVVTYDDDSTSNNPTFYVNGASITVTETTSPLGTYSSDTSIDLAIGNNEGLTNTLSGNVDEVSIWNTVLSESAIAQLYNSGKPKDIRTGNFKHLFDSNCKGYWRMGEGDTYPTITDNSSSNNDGTMTNMTSSDIEADTP